ncbi:MAG: tetratricopeptide repeat protein [Hyphomicrobiaceae bacterium]
MTIGFRGQKRISRRAAGTAMALALATATGASAGKDIGPAGGCDTFSKGTSAWSDCVGPAAQQLSDADLFYAGYWMARLGRYDQAIAYLSATKAPDARTLTYLGFATRKAGNVGNAFAYYEKALALDPDYVVARAYLGEAFVTVGNAQAARHQLAEIAKRCGATCAAYDELARHLARSEEARG